MDRKPFRKSVIVAFLALQAMATQCFPCPCGWEEEETDRAGRAVASATEALNDSKPQCLLCKATLGGRQLYRCRETHRQVPLPAVAEQQSLSLFDHSSFFNVAALGKDVAPSPVAHELQVFLE